ncbi:DUF3089 domain-containing protein [Nocardia macrotermitis]|uniref:DUF3089 domain-containing protein n=1 Tax=Nocardia macrotermitis TaxID=2585198 RepID=A0A7K0D4H5_9NOCA|nr:DUF3089 domain-containing protein [Nocardia macrotermitis]MQY20471.1 hypothetical protein [Nocardia macrotermitis]
MTQTKWRRLAALSAGIVMLAGVGLTASCDATSSAEPLTQPVWLCRPGMANNPCNQDRFGSPQTSEATFTVRRPQSHTRTDLDSTVLARDGSTTVDQLPAPNRPAVDCFYVYPTVDPVANPLDQSGNRPPKPTDIEIDTTWAQVGRLISNCRMFVPNYRQLPMPQVFGRGTGPLDFSRGARDVEQAWDEYWAHDNIDPTTGRHRGVLLLGHSQGSYVLQTLIQQRIEGNRQMRSRLISAILLGADTIVPIGQDRGGADTRSTFRDLPVCTRTGASAPVPTGCVVALSTYRQPPGKLLPTTARFGRTDRTHQVACVNPAALLSGAPASATTPITAELPTMSVTQHRTGRPYGTGFVRYPDALTAHCTGGMDANGTAHWLQIGGDTRLARTTTGAGLGLHMDDWQFAQDDLDALAVAQSKAWLATHTGPHV